MSDTDDEALTAKVRARIAANELVKAFLEISSALEAQVEAAVGGKVPADRREDVCQEVWDAVWRGIDRDLLPSNVKTWVLGIVRHKIIDEHREVGADVDELLRRHFRPSGDPPGAIDAALAKALPRLLPEEQALLRQHYQRGLSPAAIARAAGKGEAAVAAELDDVQKKLARALPRVPEPPAVPVEDVMSGLANARTSGLETKVQRAQIARALRAAVARLPPADQELYAWYYEEGLGPTAIVQQMGLPIRPDTISERLLRLRARLSTILLQDKVIQSVLRRHSA
jgi:DNA-directed RNA polymerase specialized sigma24 family protein